MNCIETQQLTHRFSDGNPVLKGIDLKVPEGSIYGFLGPNGAGKTTTMKLVLGLLKKQEGGISVFGRELEKERIQILQDVGSLVEAPSLYGHLSARDNLRIWCNVYGCDTSRIDEVLKLVDLDYTAKKKSRKFSLGMKQRLSIAVALLHEPKLLVLDEPTNGLDPNGILEMRELLKRINKETGVTIFISSHLLSEIEKLVNHVGIIHRGEMIFQGTMPELQRMQKLEAGLFVGCDQKEKVVAHAAEKGWKSVEEDDGVVLHGCPDSEVAALNTQLVQAGVAIHQLATRKNDLEAIFMDITKTEQA